MGKTTSIAWTDSTLNMAWGCTKVSAGCQNCYMFRLSKQFGRDPSKVTLFSVENARKKIPTLGKLVFVNSMSDTFHEDIPFSTIAVWITLFNSFRDHQFQILTKRINRARVFAKEWKEAGHEWPSNVWLGTSVENRHYAFRIDTLRKVEGPKIKFISFEPLLDSFMFPDLTGIQWVIVGGESGSEPRPMKELWAAEIRNACLAEDVPFFFKQVGGKGGDGAGGDLLFGRQYKELPKWE